MPYYLGFDTSNYTTSAAVFNSDDNTVIQEKLLLPVKDGQLGLRQSEAVFQHIKQLPVVVNKLFNNFNGVISAIGVSVQPRNTDGSYMPCFLCGESLAVSLAAITGINVYKTSHQTGHILAALYSADKLSMLNNKFLAFHVSGGTTDCLLCTPDEDEIISVEEIGTSLDLKAGQAVDRVGIMLGLKFPCGKELEELASFSDKTYDIKPALKGMNCCLSGVENLCKKMLEDGVQHCDIANYCISYVYGAIRLMARSVLFRYGTDLPFIFAGGVMSNNYIRRKISEEFGAYFAEPEFSSDNAAGAAVYAALKHKKLLEY